MFNNWRTPRVKNVLAMLPITQDIPLLVSLSLFMPRYFHLYHCLYHYLHCHQDCTHSKCPLPSDFYCATLAFVRPSCIEEPLVTPTQTAPISLELTEISDAVRKFISLKVQQLALVKMYNNEICDMAYGYLSSNSQGIFLLGGPSLSRSQQNVAKACP
jgi:hypothetical protein